MENQPGAHCNPRSPSVVAAKNSHEESWSRRRGSFEWSIEKISSPSMIAIDPVELNFHATTDSSFLWILIRGLTTVPDTSMPTHTPGAILPLFVFCLITTTVEPAGAAISTSRPLVPTPTRGQLVRVTYKECRLKGENINSRDERCVDLFCATGTDETP